MAGEMAIRGAGLMMAVREGSEIGEPWAPAHGCQEEEKSGKIPPLCAAGNDQKSGFPWGGACCRLEKRKRSGELSSCFSAEREGSNGLGPGGAAGCLPL